MHFRGSLVLIASVSVVAVAASSSYAVVKQPSRKASASSGDDGAQKYSPTRCEWLATEVNANFRESYPRAGYTSQFYCRAPNTIFLSFHYIKDEFKAAADDADDEVRSAIGRIMVERKWSWVKIDDEIVKGAPPAWPPPAAPAVEKKAPAPPKKEGEEEETSDDENKPADEEGSTAEDKSADDDKQPAVEDVSVDGVKPQPWVHYRHPEIEFQKKLEEQDRLKAQASSAPTPASTPVPVQGNAP